jgi:hypothetical protein
MLDRTLSMQAHRAYAAAVNSPCQTGEPLLSYFTRL